MGCGDPDRIRRLAIRFARPLPIGEVLRVHVVRAGPDSLAFEADASGSTVITHGLAQLRSPLDRGSGAET